jgi:hypothetical protein
LTEADIAQTDASGLFAPVISARLSARLG